MACVTMCVCGACVRYVSAMCPHRLLAFVMLSTAVCCAICCAAWVSAAVYGARAVRRRVGRAYFSKLEQREQRASDFEQRASDFDPRGGMDFDPRAMEFGMGLGMGGRCAHEGAAAQPPAPAAAGCEAAATTTTAAAGPADAKAHFFSAEESDRSRTADDPATTSTDAYFSSERVASSSASVACAPACAGAFAGARTPLEALDGLLRARAAKGLTDGTVTGTREWTAAGAAPPPPGGAAPPMSCPLAVPPAAFGGSAGAACCVGPKPRVDTETETNFRRARQTPP